MKRIMRSGPLIALVLLIQVASAQQPTAGPTEFFQLLLESRPTES
jgi:hypothetical protein